MTTDTTTLLQTSRAVMTKSLQHALDGASIDLKHWRAVLPFPIRTSHAPGTELNVSSDTHQCEDILEYLKPMYKRYKIYFSDKYCASISSGDGWKELLKDLAISGMQGGFYLIGNGSYKDKHIVVCRGSRLYQGTKTQQLSPSKKPRYRNETLHSDRNNSRGNVGKRLPRKTRTTRAIEKGSVCPFRISIGLDGVGYYLVGGTGNSHHAYHPKLMKVEYAVPTRLIGGVEKDILVSVGCAKANDGVGRSIHFSRCGYVIPRSQVRYINGFRSRACDDGRANRTLQDTPEQSTIDKLLTSFRTKGFDHCVLYHHVTQPNSDVATVGDPTGIMVNESFGEDSDGDVQEPCPPTSVKVVLPDSEETDMQLFARTHRHSLLVDDKQDLMIGCAWTTPPEKRLFKMFGEVLHIDCTADTNYEDRPFLTITGRDSNGKMFTVIRAFLPNERAWVFRWLFQTVMPALLGREFIGRVKVIVTDGDSQETSQLDIAIALHFQNVCRVRCGWHVVDRGWIRCCPGVRSVSRQNQSAFKANIIQIKAWLYSWMHSTCESEEEYIISKALLAAYLHSPPFVSTATEPVADRIRMFIRDNVEPLETFLCFYRRRNIRHYDTYTNSPHEGTNNGLKAGAAPVMPQHSLDRSASILNHNAHIKATSSSILSANAVSSKSLWSSLPTSQRLTHKGEGLVTQQWNMHNNYISQRVGEKHWLVTAKRAGNTVSSGLVPHFARVRKVSIVDDGILLCSCMHFERIGIPCRHQMHILRSLSEDYSGVTHHDVCVTWWQEFLAYGFSNDPKCREVSSLYKQLLFNDIKGPSLPNGIELPPIQATIVDASLAVKPTKETCLNYDVSTINLALKRSNFSIVEANHLSKVKSLF
jgi:hypothetical protein